MTFEAEEYILGAHSIEGPVIRKIHVDDDKVRPEEICNVCGNNFYPDCKEICNICDK